jgi:hypothetical protein
MQGGRRGTSGGGSGGGGEEEGEEEEVVFSSRARPSLSAHASHTLLCLSLSPLTRSPAYSCLPTSPPQGSFEYDAPACARVRKSKHNGQPAQREVLFPQQQLALAPKMILRRAHVGASTTEASRRRPGARVRRRSANSGGGESAGDAAAPGQPAAAPAPATPTPWWTALQQRAALASASAQKSFADFQTSLKAGPQVKVDVDVLGPMVEGAKKNFSALPEPVRRAAPYAAVGLGSASLAGGFYREQAVRRGEALALLRADYDDLRAKSKRLEDDVKALTARADRGRAALEIEMAEALSKVTAAAASAATAAASAAQAAALPSSAAARAFERAERRWGAGGDGLAERRWAGAAAAGGGGRLRLRTRRSRRRLVGREDDDSDDDEATAIMATISEEEEEADERGRAPPAVLLPTMPRRRGEQQQRRKATAWPMPPTPRHHPAGGHDVDFEDGFAGPSSFRAAAGKQQQQNQHQQQWRPLLTPTTPTTTTPPAAAAGGRRPLALLPPSLSSSDGSENRGGGGLNLSAVGESVAGLVRGGAARVRGAVEWAAHRGSGGQTGAAA